MLLAELWQYRPLSTVTCEMCSKRYPQNKFPRNFPSYFFGEVLFPRSNASLVLSVCVPRSLVSRARTQGQQREGTREFGGKKTARRDDRARPVAIISLAATRQMSEHCETRRLVGRFAPRFCLSRFRNNITRRNGIITGHRRGTLRAFR